MEKFTKTSIPSYMRRRILAMGTEQEMIELEKELLDNRKEKCWDKYYNATVAFPPPPLYGEDNPNWKGGMSNTREKARSYEREYREKNREKVRKRQREYRKKNSEKICESNREYYAKNAEKLREKQREYRAKNAEKIREQQGEYRAKKKAEKINGNSVDLSQFMG